MTITPLPRYGVELEFVAPRGQTMDSIGNALRANGVVADNYYSHLARTSGNNWVIKHDGSVSAMQGGSAMELVSPPLQQAAGPEAINKVSQVLTGMGSMVNVTCGLHVHVEATAMSVPAQRKLAVLYMECEPVIDMLMAPSRRGPNGGRGYARSVRQADLATIARANGPAGIARAINSGSRYSKLNYDSYTRHGTIEFRHHGGTVDGTKINMWAKACIRMAETAVREQDEPIAHIVTNTTPGSMPMARPRNARLALIYDLIARPEGATRDDVRLALGRNTAPPLNRILTQHNIPFRVRRRRYFLAGAIAAQTMVTATPIARPAMTLASFMDRLQMSTEERNYWTARAALLASAPVATPTLEVQE